DQLRAVAGRVQDPEAQRPQLQLLAVGERAERVGDPRRFVEAELAPMPRDKLARAGDGVGMDVRGADVLQPEAALMQPRLVRLGLDRRVDDRRVVRAARGYQVGGTAATLVQELLEIHEDNSRSPVLPAEARTEDWRPAAWRGSSIDTFFENSRRSAAPPTR